MSARETFAVVARYAAVMGAVFASILVVLYGSLVVWDETHPPMIPGWSARSLDQASVAGTRMAKLPGIMAARAFGPGTRANETAAR